MSFLKKNLLLCIVVALCLVAMGVGVWMTLKERGELESAQRNSASIEAQLRSLLNADPAPTEENLAAAKMNLSEVQEALAQIRAELQSGAVLDISEDGVNVIAGIQQYITKFQRAAASHTNEAGEAFPITTPNNFAFGFEQFIRQADVPDGAAKVARLDKQRQILDYLMTQLMEAEPHSIDAVRREVLESTGERAQRAFTISPNISARVPGAIDTLAFSVTFTGYTDSLRKFLNRLADPDLPIVVRSIEVNRPSVAARESTPTRSRSEPSRNIFDLFGAETDAPAARSSSGAAASDVQKPVIEENVSRFTVILEFIEVILPETHNQEVSDPA